MGFSFNTAIVSDERSESPSSVVRRLYILDITFKSGMKVIKIGVSSGKDSLDRMLQIQRDYYHKYRCTFICNIKRDRPVDKELVFKYETILHKFFSEYQYVPKIAFDGSTELFAIPVNAAVEVYEYLLENGLETLDEFEYDPEVYTEGPIDNPPF